MHCRAMRSLVAPLVLVLAFALGCGGDDSSSEEGAADAAAPTLTWANFAEEFMTTYCYECHGPGDTLRDYSLQDMVRGESASIRAGIISSQFPIGDGPFPSQAERDQLVEWLDDGAP